MSLLLSMLCLPLAAQAAPMTLNHQGYLSNANGVGLTGTHTLVFSLYDDAAATNAAVWTETISADFDDGAYSVILGMTSTIDQALLDQYPLYLGLDVDNNGDLMPRHEVVSVPYAIAAETSFNVDGGTVDATSVTVGGSTGTVIDSTGINIGGNNIIDSSGTYVGTAPAPADLGCTDGQIMVWNNTNSTWTCAAETDPVYGAAPAAGITAGDLTNWDMAYGWGDHGAANYVTYDTTDAITNDLTATQVANWDAVYDDWNANVADWDAAYGIFDSTDLPPAGDISAADVVAWDAAEATVTGSGLTAGNYNNGNWDTAYNRVNNSGLTGSNYNNSDWDSAYSYFDSTDAPATGDISATAIATWNSAYTSESDLTGLLDNNYVHLGGIGYGGDQILDESDLTNVLDDNYISSTSADDFAGALTWTGTAGADAIDLADAALVNARRVTIQDQGVGDGITFQHTSANSWQVALANTTYTSGGGNLWLKRDGAGSLYTDADTYIAKTTPSLVFRDETAPTGQGNDFSLRSSGDVLQIRQLAEGTSSAQTLMNFNYDGDIIIRPGGTEAARFSGADIAGAGNISAAGHLYGQQHFFVCYNSNTFTATVGELYELVHWASVTDPEGNFNGGSANESYTAPVDGYYRFNTTAGIRANGFNGDVGLGFKINHQNDATLPPERVLYATSVNGDGTFSLSNETVYYLTAGDTVSVWIDKVGALNATFEVEHRSFVGHYIGD